MLTVHHLSNSQSERIVWLCEELAIPYELKRYAREPATKLAPPDYKALYPVGSAPVIIDGGLVLAETAAIIEYLIAKHGGQKLTVASDQPNFADYLFWFHFANGTLVPAEIVRIVYSDKTAPVTGMAKRADLAYPMIEKRLGAVPYFAGDKFTAADIMMVYPLTRLRKSVGRDLAAFPNIRAYLKRIDEHTAYRRAMEKADPGVPVSLE